jgi:hypothetical protein
MEVGRKEWREREGSRERGERDGDVGREGRRGEGRERRK